MARALMKETQYQRFLKEKEIDFSYNFEGKARFRVNIFLQRGSVSCAFRLIPSKIPTFEELNLPPILHEFTRANQGFVLITGPSSQGKSTTLAAMINYLNENETKNIITIEDPIEFLFTDKQCLISQRDLGDDTRSFDIALRHALRHDPDVIVVGEMRDLPTMTTAIRAAETGHLVMGTLHTIDTTQTVDRIIDMFPADQQQQIRLQLSQVLVAVLSQALLPRMEGKGRVAAFEIMGANSAVRNLIREGKTYELHNVIQLHSSDGMQTLDQALAGLVRMKTVSVGEAVMKSSHPDRLEKLIQFNFTATTI